MAELSDMISSILKDPESMQLVSSLLGGISGAEEGKKEEPSLALPDVTKLAPLMQKLSGPPDERCQLLMALRPFVDAQRREKIDQSIRILKLMSLAQEMGGLGIV